MVYLERHLHCDKLHTLKSEGGVHEHAEEAQEAVRIDITNEPGAI